MTESLWDTLRSIVPMPISQTRDRIMEYLSRVHAMGLITTEEFISLEENDRREREVQVAMFRANN